MAGPSIGTWVKVRNKSGRMTAKVLAKKYGGGSYQQGEVITQSEYQSFQKKRAEAIAAGDDTGKKKGKDSGGTYTIPAESAPKPYMPFKQEVGAKLFLETDESYSPVSEKVSRSRVDSLVSQYKKIDVDVEPPRLTALVIQDNKGAYEVVAGKENYLASKRAGHWRMQAIVGNEDVRKFAGIEKIRDKQSMTVKAEKPPGLAMFRQEEGALINVYPNETYLGKSVKVSPKRVAAYEKAIRETKDGRLGGNWMPVYVKQNRQGYEVVGNHEVYVAAKRAGVDKIWTVIVGENDMPLFKG